MQEVKGQLGMWEQVAALKQGCWYNFYSLKIGRENMNSGVEV